MLVEPKYLAAKRARGIEHGVSVHEPAIAEVNEGPRFRDDLAVEVNHTLVWNAHDLTSCSVDRRPMLARADHKRYTPGRGVVKQVALLILGATGGDSLE